MMLEEKDRWEEVLDLPNQGVFRVKYKRMTLKALKGYRTRVENKVWKLRRLVANQQNYIEHLKKELKECEDLLNRLTEDRMKHFQEIERKQKQQALERASQFLRGYIGEQNYQKLEREGYFLFKGLDGNRYRIKRNGELQQIQGKYWYHCCWVRRGDLPLPDYIASVFTATKHDIRFHAQTRRTKTKEEVIE